MQTSLFQNKVVDVPATFILELDEELRVLRDLRAHHEYQMTDPVFHDTVRRVVNATIDLADLDFRIAEVSVDVVDLYYNGFSNQLKEQVMAAIDVSVRMVSLRFRSMGLYVGSQLPFAFSQIGWDNSLVTMQRTRYGFLISVPELPFEFNNSAF